MTVLMATGDKYNLSVDKYNLLSVVTCLAYSAGTCTCILLHRKSSSILDGFCSRLFQSRRMHGAQQQQQAAAAAAAAASSSCSSSGRPPAIQRRRSCCGHSCWQCYWPLPPTPLCRRSFCLRCSSPHVLLSPCAPLTCQATATLAWLMF
jgi:hypothetical protein